MSILKVTHIGFWYELLLPYVCNCPSSGSYMSVNDFLYDWVRQVGWNNPNYKYIFNTTWTYLLSIQLLHIGVRRNNAEYIRAEHMTFHHCFTVLQEMLWFICMTGKHTVYGIVWSVSSYLILHLVWSFSNQSDFFLCSLS